MSTSRPLTSTCLSLVLAVMLVAPSLMAAVEARAATRSISSEPSTAAVSVDGQPLGQTPTTAADLPAGNHRVRVVKDRYLASNRVVTVNGGRRGALGVLLAARPAAQATAGAAGLTILVIAGEGAVNIIQQKTAVAPVVEVRDRNAQPVAGAVVRFSIEGGRATFGGARAMTLTTDAAGRASVASLTPTASGSVTISASASFQGQVATVTIVQTNVVTVAAAAAAATAAAASTGGATAGAAAAGAAAGGGIGVSATTLAIVGGAVAGGTVLTTKVVGAGGNASGIYEGDFHIDVIDSVRYRQNSPTFLSCTSRLSFNGEVRAVIDVPGDGSIAGHVSANGYVTVLSTTCPFSVDTSEKIGFGSGNVAGTAASFQASEAPRMSFSGALNGGAITGTFTITGSYRSSNYETDYPATSTPVTLTK